MRCFVGMRHFLSKKDERYKDSLSMEMYFQALWVVDIQLPRLEEVEKAIEMPIQVAPLPSTLLPPSSTPPQGVDPLFRNRFIQFIHTLAHMKDKDNRNAGQQFVTLPRKLPFSLCLQPTSLLIPNLCEIRTAQNIDQFFYSKVIGDSRCLSTILTA